MIRILSCAFLLIATVTCAHADFTVGDTRFKLVGQWFDPPKYFKGENFPTIVTDKDGCRYSFPFWTANDEKIPGVSVETDMKVLKQVFKWRPYGDDHEEYNFPITDLYNPAENTTVTGEPTKGEYTIRYVLSGQPLAEFKGNVVVRWDDGIAYLSPQKGVFRFTCGEVWSLHVKDSSNTPEFEKPSPEAQAMKEKGSAVASKESKKATAEKAKKMADFRKKAKVGSKVRVFSGGTFQAQGLIIGTKKDLVKVQFTEQVILSQWRNVRPFVQWVERASILPPDGQSEYR